MKIKRKNISRILAGELSKEDQLKTVVDILDNSLRKTLKDLGIKKGVHDILDSLPFDKKTKHKMLVTTAKLIKADGSKEKITASFMTKIASVAGFFGTVVCGAADCVFMLGRGVTDSAGVAMKMGSNFSKNMSHGINKAVENVQLDENFMKAGRELQRANPELFKAFVGFATQKFAGAGAQAGHDFNQKYEPVVDAEYTDVTDSTDNKESSHDWWGMMTDDEKERYIERHPRSKYAQNHKAAPKQLAASAQEITIKILDPKTKEISESKIAAHYIIGDWAVTKDKKLDITHVPSGMTLGLSYRHNFRFELLKRIANTLNEEIKEQWEVGGKPSRAFADAVRFVLKNMGVL